MCGCHSERSKESRLVTGGYSIQLRGGAVNRLTYFVLFCILYFFCISINPNKTVKAYRQLYYSSKRRRGCKLLDIFCIFVFLYFYETKQNRYKFTGGFCIQLRGGAENRLTYFVLLYLVLLYFLYF